MAEEKITEFEMLISQADLHQDLARAEIKRASEVKPSKTKAEKTATLFDAIVMIGNLAKQSLKDLKVEFSTYDQNYIFKDPEIKIDNPYITFRVISRKPKVERKPRVRETIDDNSLMGEIYGQKFTCIVQFNIFGATANDAEIVMQRFEEMVFNYTGYLKRNGVSEILFEDQITDDEINNFHQILSVRSIRYRIEIEHIYHTLEEDIIDTDVHNINFPESVSHS